MSKIVKYLTTRRQLSLRRKTAKEVCGPCFSCGGRDRFIIWTDTDRYWCRKCDIHGDYIQLLIDAEKLSFKQAAKKAGRPLTAQLPTVSKGRVQPRDRVKHPTHGKPDVIYDYLLADGTLAYRICRWEAGELRDRKVFSQVSPDGKKWGMKDIYPVLYNLLEIQKSKEIFLVEGEKCVEAIRKCGLVSTTIPGGSSALKTMVERYDILSPLEGKKVYVVPDNDNPGQYYAEEMARNLTGKASEIKILHLYYEQSGEDIADFFEGTDAATTRLELLRRVKITDPWVPPKEIWSMEELLGIELSKQASIIEGVFPANAHILIAGEAGIGKSLLRTELALHLAYGKDWLGLRIPKKRRVGIFQWENTEKMERQRLVTMMHGLKIRIVTPNFQTVARSIRIDLTRKKDQEKLIQLIRQLQVEVLIYDCLSNMHTARENDNIKMREVLDTLVHINSLFNTSCILIHHFGKPSQGGNQEDKYRIRGASSLIDWAVTALTYTGWTSIGDSIKEYRNLNFVKLRDNQAFPTILCERDPKTFLLKRIRGRSEQIQQWLQDYGEWEDGKESFVNDVLVPVLKMGRNEARKALRIAYKDGFIDVVTHGNRWVKIHTAEPPDIDNIPF